MINSKNIFLIIFFLTLYFSSPSFNIFADQIDLSLPEALKQAITKNLSLQSIGCDWLQAQAKGLAIEWRRMPSLNILASYKRLSELPPTTIEIPSPIGSGNINFEFSPSFLDCFNFSFNLQYPIFAGLRISEAAKIASLNGANKILACELAYQSLIFETTHAYWETVRAQKNLKLLEESLNLAKKNYELTFKEFEQGRVFKANLLSAETCLKQTQIDLANGKFYLRRFYLNLANLMGFDLQLISLKQELFYILVSKPKQGCKLQDFLNLGLEKAMQRGPGQRSELGQALVGKQLAEHSLFLTQADFYPTISLLGNITIASSKPRVAFQSEIGAFTTPWAFGVQVLYNLGSLPITIAESLAASRAVQKAETDFLHLQNTVIFDIGNFYSSFLQAAKDVGASSQIIRGAIELQDCFS